MPAYRLRHFSDPQTLHGISPSRLLALLDPYRRYFAARECELPAIDDADPDFDYEQLAAVFITPDTSTPDELVHAILLIDEMSTQEATDDLLDIALERGIPIDDGDDHTSADIAVQLWLRDRDTLEQRHARQFLLRARSFEYFQTDGPMPPVLAAPSTATRSALQESLDAWFIDHKRGGNSRVFVFPQEDLIWFLVRHGETLKREESVHNGETTTICYRPLKYDVLIYKLQNGVLKINARLKGERQLYLEQFALHLFPDGTTFSAKPFTLKPLLEYGEDSLAFGDISGIEGIKLTELEIRWGGGFQEVEIRKADDLFGSFKARKYSLSEKAPLKKAVFKITFSDSEKPRSVTVRSSNSILYTRDTDAPAVEQWLELREFSEQSRFLEHEPAT